ncbi:MAG TPA: hypothetical protein VGA40_08260 [Candidatus Acidoferrales bacterium]
MKRLFICSGTVSALGLIGLSLPIGREWIAALVLFGVVYVAVFMTLLIWLLIENAAFTSVVWLRSQAPHWNRAGRERMQEITHALQVRHLWPKWTHKASASASSVHGD